MKQDARETRRVRQNGEVASSSRRGEGVYIEVHNRNITKKSARYVDSKMKQDASSSRRGEGVYIEVHNRNTTKKCAAYSSFFYKNKALASCKGYHFHIQLWAFPHSLHLLLRSYVARRLFAAKRSGYFYFVGTPLIISFIGVYLFYYFLMKYLTVGI